MNDIVGSAVTTLVIAVCIVIIFDLLFLIIGTTQFLVVKQATDRGIKEQSEIISSQAGVEVSDLTQTDEATTYHLRKDINLIVLDKIITGDNLITLEQDYRVEVGG